MAAALELYNEVLPIVKKLNFVLTLNTEVAFRRIETKDLLAIRYLTVVWEGDDEDCGLFFGNPIPRSIEVLHDKNNLQGITLDLRSCSPFARPASVAIHVIILIRLACWKLVPKATSGNSAMQGHSAMQGYLAMQGIQLNMGFQW